MIEKCDSCDWTGDYGGNRVVVSITCGPCVKRLRAQLRRTRTNVADAIVLLEEVERPPVRVTAAIDLLRGAAAPEE